MKSSTNGKTIVIFDTVKFPQSAKLPFFFSERAPSILIRTDTIANPRLLIPPIMTLTSEQITQFQRLYLKRFGVQISREKAQEEGIKLVRLMQLVYKPMTQADEERWSQRRRDLNSRETEKGKKAR